MILKIITCSLLLGINLAFLIYLLINFNKINGRRLDEENSILVTPVPQGKIAYLVMLITTNVGYIALLIYSVLSNVDVLSFVMFVILLVMINGLSINFFIKYLFEYVKLFEGKFYVKKFLKEEKVFEVSSIKKSLINQNRIYLVNEEGHTLFYLVYNYQNVDKIISHLYLDNDVEFDANLLKYYKINLKKTVEDSVGEENEKNEISAEEDQTNKEDQENDKYSPEQVEKFTEIGQTFRNNIKKNKINDIVKHIILQIIVAGFIVFFSFYFKNFLLLIILLLNVFLAYSKIKELKNKYNIEDKNYLDLGIKFAYLDKRVKGYHERKNKMLKSTFLIVGIFVVIYVVFSGYLLFTSKPIDISSSSYTLIEGKLSSATISNNTISIKITDEENKYNDHTFQIPSALFKYYDSQELLSEEIDQTIVIKSDLTSSSKTTLALYVKIGDKEYVNQDSLTNYFNDYMKKQKNSFIVSIVVGVVVIGGSFGYYYYNKSMIKKEVIDLSK